MKNIVEVFRSRKKEGTYVYLPKGAVIESLPKTLLEQLGKLERVLSFVLTPEKKLANANAMMVLESLDTQGFYLQLPPPAETDMQGIENAKLQH